MTDNNYPYKPYTEPAHTQSTVTVSAGTKDTECCLFLFLAGRIVAGNQFVAVEVNPKR